MLVFLNIFSMICVIRYSMLSALQRPETTTSASALSSSEKCRTLESSGNTDASSAPSDVDSANANGGRIHSRSSLVTAP
jgi:hypothetical protein